MVWFSGYSDEIRALYHRDHLTQSDPKPRISKSTRIWDIFFLTLNLFQFFRVFIAGLAIQLNFASDYFAQYDITLGEVNSGGQIDGIAFMLGSTIYLEGIYFHVCLFVNNLDWVKYVYDLVVRNREHFFRLNPHLKLNSREFRRKPLREIKRNLRSNYEVLRSNKATPKLGHTELVFNPHISLKLRIQTIYLSLSIDLFDCVYRVLVWSFYGLFLLVYYQFRLKLKYSFGMVVFVLVNLFVLEVNVHYVAQDIFYLIYSLLTLSFVYMRHLNELNRKFLNCLTVKRRRAVSRKVKYLLSEHHRLVSTIWRLNACISTPILAVFASFLGFNVYVSTILMVKQNLYPINRALYSLIIVLQLACLITGALLMIRITSSIHSTKKFIAHASPLLSKSSNNIRLKWKMANFYEFVNSKSKVVFTLGSIGQISQKSLFEFMLVYFAYLMCTIKFINNID